MEAICYLSTTFTNFLPVFEEIRQCIACTCYALFSSSVSSTCEGTSLPRFPTQKVGKIRPRAQAAPPPLYMEEGARPNPPPRAAAAAKSARGKSKSILPPSPHTLTPHSYPLFPPPPRPWHSLPKWAASSVVEGGRGKGIGGPARGRRGDGKTARRSTVLVEGRRKRGMRISPSVRPFVTVLVPPAQPSQVIPPPLPPSNKCRSFSPSVCQQPVRAKSTLAEPDLAGYLHLHFPEEEERRERRGPSFCLLAAATCCSFSLPPFPARWDWWSRSAIATFRRGM